MKKVPYFRPEIGEEEVKEVVEVLRSGWLTTGERVKRFESSFAEAVGATHAVALNSCTAALHLAVDAQDLQPGDVVLVPSMTFASTAEVVRYEGGIPALVDCNPETLNMDLNDAERKLNMAHRGELPGQDGRPGNAVGLIPVHVGGLMMDMDAVKSFAVKNGLWTVEDAAHAFPAAWRKNADSSWQRSGENTAEVSCFSFYANKTITTGEGGMAVTASQETAERIRLMSLHGLSKDAWARYSGSGNWDYRIVAPGYKYNMTDVLAAIGIHQLNRADDMARLRGNIAGKYMDAFKGQSWFDVPPDLVDRKHSWHLYPIRLCLEKLRIDRNVFVQELRKRGVGFSVHWRPLHFHPYYENLGWLPRHCAVASTVWERLVSLPIFPAMKPDESDYVIEQVLSICEEYQS